MVAEAVAGEAEGVTEEAGVVAAVAEAEAVAADAEVVAAVAEAEAVAQAVAEAVAEEAGVIAAVAEAVAKAWRTYMETEGLPLTDCPIEDLFFAEAVNEMSRSSASGGRLERRG